MSGSPNAIIYVPGMKPKPPVEDQRRTLWRCLLEGVRRGAPAVATELARRADSFRLVAWTPLFYDTVRDLALDLPGVERLLSLPGPEEEDIQEAGHWHKRLGRFIYLLSDAFPFLIDYVATEAMKATLHDSLRYFRNHGGVADQIRRMVAEALQDACDAGSRVLLIAHSLGSVIAFDTLWELSRLTRSNVRVDQFLTMGSPLGMNFVRHRLLGAHERRAGRYPNNIRRWRNLSAVGEMTALDRQFADDYRQMVDLGLIESIIDDINLQTYFRGPEGLNVHKCYGYMVNHRVGAAIGEWWQEAPDISGA